MTTFANTINGNEILAKRSQCDYAGNDLQTTYATKSEVTTGLSAKEDSANKAQTLDPTSTTEFPSSAATANFVNSSVATATANFLGNFTLQELGLTYPATDAQIGTALDSHTWPAGVTPTNNDYTYVEIQDPQTTGIDDRVERFKFNGTSWMYEYTLNNSSFTSQEKAAIDSGIDSTKVTAYDTHIADTTIHVTSTDKSTWNAKQDAISDLATIRSGASLGATAVQPADLATVATTGAYSDLSGTPTIVDNGKIYGMDGTESFNDIYTKLSVDGIGITWVLNRVSPYAGKATYTACEIVPNDATHTTGFLRLACVMRANNSSNQITVFLAEAHGGTTGFGTPTYSLSSTPVGSENQVYSWNSYGVAIARNINEVPSYTTSEDGKVLGVVDNSGTASLEWVTPAAGGVTDVEVDGTSVVSGGVASITMPTELVPAVTSSDDAKVLKASYTGGVGSYSWEAESGGGVTDVEVDGVSVVSQGVASITMPTVDQTYDGTSTNAQSGTAVAGAIANINQVPASTSSDSGKVLTVDSNGDPGWVTGGGGGVQSDWTEADPTSMAYIENKPTPKTLTAGDGIAVTESSNAITVSSNYSETVLYYNANGAYLKNGITLSESRQNFEIIRIIMSLQPSHSVGSVDIPMYGINTGTTFTIQPSIPFDETSAGYVLNWKVFITASNTSLTSTNAIYWGKSSCDGTSTNPGTWTQGANANVPYVYKVIGINRISN